MFLDPFSTCKPISAPGGALIALAAQYNTVEIQLASTGQVHATYYGHQEGMHRLIHETITDIMWETETVCLSTSSSGARHRFDARRGIHLATLTLAHQLRGKEHVI